MKVLLLAQSYNTKEWIIPIIEHYRDYVDDIIFCEGRDDDKGSIRSDDGTRELLESYKKKHMITLVDSTPDPSKFEFELSQEMYAPGNPRYNQGYKLWGAIKQSKYFKENNWILICDNDMFIDEEILSNMREFLSNRIDVVKFKQNRFFFNFRTISAKEEWMKFPLFRITDGMSVTPIFKPIFKDKTLYHECGRELKIEGNTHHYSFIKSLEQLKLRYLKRSEHTRRFRRMQIFINNLLKLTIDNQHTRTWDKIITSYLPLVEYNGPWPPAIVNHPWFGIEDSREI